MLTVRYEIVLRVIVPDEGASRVDNRTLCYESEEIARSDLPLLDKISKSGTRLGKVSAAQWLDDDPSTDALCEAQDARISKLANILGYDVWLDSIVSFAQVTVEPLSF